MKKEDIIRRILLTFIALLIPLWFGVQFAYITFTLPSSHIIWYVFAAIVISIIAFVILQKRITLLLTIFLEFILAGLIIGYYVIDSLYRGVELIAGPQPQSWFGMPLQYGLINYQDMILGFGVLILAMFVGTYFTFQRRRLGQK